MAPSSFLPAWLEQAALMHTVRGQNASPTAAQQPRMLPARAPAPESGATGRAGVRSGQQSAKQLREHAALNAGGAPELSAQHGAEVGDARPAAIQSASEAQEEPGHRVSAQTAVAAEQMAAEEQRSQQPNAAETQASSDLRQRSLAAEENPRAMTIAVQNDPHSADVTLPEDAALAQAVPAASSELAEPQPVSLPPSVG